MKTTTMEKMTTEAILTQLTKVTRKPKEGTQRYLRRIVVASDTKISDDQFDRLPDRVADWLDNGTDAIKNKKSIPLFPEAGGSGSIEAAASDVNRPKEDVKVKTSKKVQPTKKATTKAAKTTVKSKSKHLKVVKTAPVYKKSTLPKGATGAIRQMTLMNPGASKAQIEEKLRASGVTCNPTTLSVTYSATKEMIEISKQLKIKF
jgi:hypothetical protein